MPIRYTCISEINANDTLFYHLYTNHDNDIHGYHDGFHIIRTSNAWEDGSWGCTENPLVEVSFLQFFASNFKQYIRNQILEIMFDYMKENQANYGLSDRFL